MIEPEIRALSVSWFAEVDAIAEDMYADLMRLIPVVEASTELSSLTLASCRSNVETILLMLQNGIAASATEAPVTALEHARLMAQRGAEVNDTLRFYRLGQGYFLQRWTADLISSIDDRDRLRAAMQQSAAFMVEYIDIVSARVSAEHLAERERRQRRTALMRADVVGALLRGEAVDAPHAERVLGHRLDGGQLAFLCWAEADRDTAELERAAATVAEALGTARPLLIADSPKMIGGWVTRPADAAIDHAGLAAAVAGLGGQIAVACGTVHPGLEGFSASRREAERARRVAGLSGQVQGVTHFAEVSLLDLLTADVPAARAFVRAELRALAGPDDATEAIRQTVLAVLAPRGGPAAAARELSLHRNTVLQRIQRAEALRGAPIDERPAELYVALTLADRLGPGAR